ncbi:MAG: bifunctional adenosylcobinamide kinase/adenosylcobinamide-phosphate guanylyltransferase [Thiolinea sp.]
MATATAGDPEMLARIQRHQQDRPAHWSTVEEPLALADVGWRRQLRTGYYSWIA